MGGAIERANSIAQLHWIRSFDCASHWKSLQFHYKFTRILSEKLENNVTKTKNRRQNLKVPLNFQC